MTSSNLTYSWQARPETVQLKETWRKITREVQTNLFLSNDWLRAFLTSYGEPDWMLSIYHQAELVGVAFFNERIHKRPFGIHAKTLHLNHSGSLKRDQIWPEYNQLLCIDKYKEQISSSLIENVFQSHPAVDEIDTGLCMESFIENLEHGKCVVESMHEVKSFVFDCQITPYEQCFSTNLKSEIKRSERGLQEIGSVDVQFVTNPSVCWHLFENMAPMHIEAWGESSGFNNDEFMSFHRSLILNSNSDVKPILVNLFVENQENTLVCCHYLLVHRETAYFYLGVSNKEIGKRIKPGTYLHAKTIEQLGKLGCLRYDFLGGDYRYKRRMSNKVIEMSQHRIKRNIVKFKFERTLKALKHKIEGLRA